MSFNDDFKPEIPFSSTISPDADNFEEELPQSQEHIQLTKFQTKISNEIEDKIISFYYLNTEQKVPISKIELSKQINIILENKQYIASDLNIKNNLQKQVINLILKLIYKTTQNELIKSILEEEARNIYLDWFKLIVTTQKFKEGNDQLNKLYELNKHPKYIAWLQKQKKENKNLFMFNITFFNECLKKVQCQIKIQNSTQFDDLEYQIYAIKNYLKFVKGTEEQQQDIEFLELQICAFEQVILEILKEKFSTIKEKKQSKIKRTVNFNNENLINLLKQPKFMMEFDDLLQILQRKDQEITYEKQILKLETDEQIKNFNLCLDKKKKKIFKIPPCSKKVKLNQNNQYAKVYLSLEFQDQYENNESQFEPDEQQQQQVKSDEEQ
ncbi:unnamed protein product [Paramecium sonneborni]|uniref:Uncharacterized protein n=1 Tax=Paramecium sonneborni TaxID=65129 RepID=A0A8S1RKZ0_9CILI|nr:unnamed protein product [Paramecium sonneborni]